MTELGGLLVMVGVPSILCAIAGTIQGRRPTATRTKIVFGALIVSGITCWTSAAGVGGDMAFPALLPSWFIAPFGPFAGPKVDFYPPWWLSPWLPFVVYLIAAGLARKPSTV